MSMQSKAVQELMSRVFCLTYKSTQHDQISLKACIAHAAVVLSYIESGIMSKEIARHPNRRRQFESETG